MSNVKRVDVYKRQVQTPQIFKADLIENAYAKLMEEVPDNITDDAMVCLLYTSVDGNIGSPRIKFCFAKGGHDDGKNHRVK